MQAIINNFCKRSMRLVAILLASALFVDAQAVNLSQKVEFNIPAQELSAALIQFSHQAKVQIVVSGKLGKQTAAALVGSHPIGDALAKLLSASGLSYRVASSTSITVGKPERSSDAGGQTMVLALADASGASVKADNGVEEMLVEGEREKPAPFSTANLDLTRTRDDVLPFTVFTARDVELSGATTLQEFFQRRLPQNTNPNLPDEFNSLATGDPTIDTQVNMRGWGNDETVFLLNGRRLPPEYKGFTTANNSMPSLRGIPIGQVERIEILPSAGSAIYGANATGGIINIITRQDIRGGQLMVNYESPADVAAATRNVDFSYGLPLRKGLGLRLSGGYNDNDPLHARDRSGVTVERWRRLMQERMPGYIEDPYNIPPFGATPNISSANYGPLFGPGTPTLTSVPEGYDGTGTIADFIPGVYNLGMAEGAAGASIYATDSLLGNVVKTRLFGVGLDKTLGAHLRWSIDYNYSKSDTEGNVDNGMRFYDMWDPLSTSPMVPGSAAINPFGQDVVVHLVDSRIQQPGLLNESSNESSTVASTLHATFGDWQAVLDASYTRNRNRYMRESFLEPVGGWTNAFVTGAYNPFVDVRTVPPASAEFYRNYILNRRIDASTNRSYQAAAKISGPVLQLPAGAARLTAGLSWSSPGRDSSYSRDIYLNTQTGLGQAPVGMPWAQVQPDGSYSMSTDAVLRYSSNSYAAYAETTLPLVAPRQSIPLVDSMEFFGSARLDEQRISSYRTSVDPDDYSTTYLPFSATHRNHVYAFGLRYGMMEGVQLRISQSIGFKPPQTNQLAPRDPPWVGQMSSSFVDRIRSQTQQLRLTHTQYLQGGNPELLPEDSESTNIGLILTPRWLQNTRVSVDYLETVRGNAIRTSPQPQEIVDLESELPGRVQRGAPDGHPSGVGPIVFLDYRSYNLRELASKSVDFNVEREFTPVFGGRMMFSLAATHYLSFKVQSTALRPHVQMIRNRDNQSFGQQIEWNGNAQLNWEGRRWGFGWGTQYFDYVLIASYYSITAAQLSDRAPRALNHDITVNYRTPVEGNAGGIRGLFMDSSITLGVKNVLNREPRFWALSPDYGVAPYDSMMGREVWLQLRKSFK